MGQVPVIANLQHDHNRLRELAANLDTFLIQPAPPSGPEFAQLRWRLVRELSMHLAAERPALQAWQRSAGAAANNIDLSLDAAFTDHVVEWSGASLTQAWDSYRLSARALLARLRSRMDREERLMFPALKQAGRA
jgi:hypothetical protein